jgi:hypothetical protein
VVELADVTSPDAGTAAPKRNELKPEVVKGAYHNGPSTFLTTAVRLKSGLKAVIVARLTRRPALSPAFALPVSNVAATVDRKAKQTCCGRAQCQPSKRPMLASGLGLAPFLKVMKVGLGGRLQRDRTDCGVQRSLDDAAFRKKRRPEGGKPIGPGYVVSQVQGGVLWLGLNAGEWGGGLRRITLADGVMGAPSDIDPKTLCGGALNPGCHPVTGLAPDPSHPDCVLAAVGLVHMMSHGGVVRVCGKDVSLAYAKPIRSTRTGIGMAR